MKKWGRHIISKLKKDHKLKEEKKDLCNVQKL